ncbi:MAG: Crp/Fnr family transcriptional regulator [bacterium]
MDQTTKLEALKAQTLFANLSDADLTPLTTYCFPRVFEKGEVLWQEGAPAQKFTFLARGRIKIVKTRMDGGEANLGVFDEGDAVGQVAVFRRMPYPASAVALADGWCLEVLRQHFYTTLQMHPDLMEGMIDGIMARNHDLVRRVEELTTSSAEQRLAMLFCNLCEKHGKRVPVENGKMGILLDMHLSRKDIADSINVRVETAIRLMSRWNKSGPVTTLPDGFLVVDCEHLDALAEGD